MLKNKMIYQLKIMLYFIFDNQDKNWLTFIILYYKLRLTLTNIHKGRFIILNPTSEAKLVVGLDWVDAALNGGIQRESLVYLLGNPGTGRSAIATHFLLSPQNSKSLWIGINSPSPQLPEDLKAAWNLRSVKRIFISLESI